MYGPANPSAVDQIIKLENVALKYVRLRAMPITNEVYRILYERKPPRAAVTDLMLRLPKVEWP